MKPSFLWRLFGQTWFGRLLKEPSHRLGTAAVIAIVTAASLAISGYRIAPQLRVNCELTESEFATLVVFLVGATVMASLFLFTGVMMIYPPWDGEPRCRNCRYILRGLTEPRCPECGEKI